MSEEESISDNLRILAGARIPDFVMKAFELHPRAWKAGRKKVAYATWIYCDVPGRKYALRLHDTDVATFTLKGIELSSGGWYTRITKEHINSCLTSSGIRGGVFSQKGSWYYRDAECDSVAKFRDGMMIGYDGKVVA